MYNLISSFEIEEIAESLILAYIDNYSEKLQCVNIEGLIEEYLSLPIKYVQMAEKDLDKLGFISDGKTPLCIYEKGNKTNIIYPLNTIVIDKYLLNVKDRGRRRFTLAHEVGHLILNKVNACIPQAGFYREYDNESGYSLQELHDRMNLSEVQANAFAASLLMPKFLLEKAMQKYAEGRQLPIYGNSVLKQHDKAIINKMADSLGVSYTALFIRLRKLGYFKQYDMNEYLVNELHLGGNTNGHT